MSGSKGKDIIILMVDNDPEDVFLTKHAFKKGKLANDFRTVGNGQELLDYLRNEGEFADSVAHPRPHIVLLDINMPVMDGFEALKEVRGDERISDVPIVIMTTSREHGDISRGYANGANSYIAKPVTPRGMMDVVEAMEDYWFKIVQIPKTPHAST